MLALALGIGATTTIFGLLNAVLLRPLPYPEADRLVEIWGTVQRQQVERRGTSFPDYFDWRDQTRSFDAMAAWIARQLHRLRAGRAGAGQRRNRRRSVFRSARRACDRRAGCFNRTITSPRRRRWP